MNDASFLERMTWAVDRAEIDDAMQLLVLQHLTRHANDAGLAWPLINSIATRIRKDRKTVQRKLAELERLGLIERQRVRKHNGNFGGWIFRVLVPGVSGATTAEQLPRWADLLDIPDAWKQPVDESGRPAAVVDAPKPAGRARPRKVEPAGETMSLLADDCPPDDYVDEVIDVEVVDDEVEAVVEPAVELPVELSPDDRQPEHHLGNLLAGGRQAPLPLTGALVADLVALGDADPGDDTRAINAVAGQVLGYYLGWRSHQQLNRPPEKWVGELRIAAKALLTRGFAPLGVLHAVLSWHDLNAQAYAAGRRVTPPGGVVNAAERNQIEGLRHGIDGEGLTRDQAVYNAELDALEQVQQMLAAV